MERRNFLKMMAIGGLAIAVSPSVLSNTNTNKTQYDVCLFYKGKEIRYRSYKRQSCLLENLFKTNGHDSIMLALPNSTFDLRPEYKVVIDEVRVIRAKDEVLCVVYKNSHSSDWTVMHGKFDVIWN